MALAGKAVIAPCKKLARFGSKMFRRGFNSSKCKTVARLATSRIKLLRNKRDVQIKQMRRDVALLLQSGQDATARIRVEHVIREQNIMAANEIIELFCELVVARLTIISKQRECPADLKEGISSLLFAAPRCSDIPELSQIRSIFEKKYGKDFVSAAMDLRPDCGVNRTLIEKLSVRTPTGEVKLKIMKEIAKEYQIEWDTTESELELLEGPEELIGGPRTFVSATSLPVKSLSTLGGPRTFVSATSMPVKSPFTQVSEPNGSCMRSFTQVSEPNGSSMRSFNDRESSIMNFKDTASAAQAAADSAQKAVAAAQAAAYLANQNSQATFDSFSLSNDPQDVKTVQEFQNAKCSLSNPPGRMYQSQSFGRSQYMSNEETAPINFDDSRENHKRHSYSNVPVKHSDIKFDESDGFDSETDEEIEMEKRSVGIHPPPNRTPPPLPSSQTNCPEERTATDNYPSYKQYPVSRVHPKLPDYDSLSARFEALKFHKSRTE